MFSDRMSREILDEWNWSERYAAQRPGGIHRPVDPHPDVRRALGTWNRPVLGGDVGIGRYLQGGQQLGHGGPSLDDVGDRIEAAGDRLLQQVQGFTYIGVDEIGSRAGQWARPAKGSRQLPPGWHDMQP
jgi:hypothetical protein